jgi:hypothetical protein
LGTKTKDKFQYPEQINKWEIDLRIKMGTILQNIVVYYDYVKGNDKLPSDFPEDFKHDPFFTLASPVIDSWCYGVDELLKLTVDEVENAEFRSSNSGSFSKKNKIRAKFLKNYFQKFSNPNTSLTEDDVKNPLFHVCYTFDINGSFYSFLASSFVVFVWYDFQIALCRC